MCMFTKEWKTTKETSNPVTDGIRNKKENNKKFRIPFNTNVLEIKSQ